MKHRLDRALLVFAIAAIAGLTVIGQVASGPPYVLKQAVNGGGGDRSASGGNTYVLVGVVGQPMSGGGAVGGPYVARTGFYAGGLAPLPPTAAGVTIGGRVLSEDGRGITNAKVTLSGGPLTEPRIATSGRNGNFEFADVQVGQTYLLSVASRRFVFAQANQIISVTDNLNDIVFVGSGDR